MSILHNTIADAARSKKACNTSISPTCTPQNNLKLPRESQWTPWGWA